jgi:putative transcriptional regulator
MERFGEKLRTLRERHGMSLRDLAEALGYPSHGYIGNLESGRRKPSLEMAFKIAKLFNVSVEQLADDELELDE